MEIDLHPPRLFIATPNAKLFAVAFEFYFLRIPFLYTIGFWVFELPHTMLVLRYFLSRHHMKPFAQKMVVLSFVAEFSNHLFASFPHFQYLLPPLSYFGCRLLRRKCRAEQSFNALVAALDYDIQFSVCFFHLFSIHALFVKEGEKIYLFPY